MTQELKHTFGFQQVDVHERRRRIRRVFDTVAPRYDLMNDLMSFGIHRLWKRAFVNHVATTCPHAEVIIDLAGGTGDIADLLASRYHLPLKTAAGQAGAGQAREGQGSGRRPFIVVADPALPMMQAGRRRLGPRARRIGWLAAEGERLPFADAGMDAITISFGLRNMAEPERALEEIHRVLKPGGYFFCLEFSRPAPWLKPFYDLYSFHVIPRLGAMVARAPFAYRYLVESIRRFPGQQALTEMIRNAGFADVQWRNLSFGIAAIHTARKQADEQEAPSLPGLTRQSRATASCADGSSLLDARIKSGHDGSRNTAIHTAHKQADEQKAPSLPGLTRQSRATASCANGSSLLDARIKSGHDGSRNTAIHTARKQGDEQKAPSLPGLTRQSRATASCANGSSLLDARIKSGHDGKRAVRKDVGRKAGEGAA